MARSQIVVERQVKTSKKAEMSESLRGLIQESLENIEEMNHKKKLLDESIKSILGNDSTYRNHEEAAKEAEIDLSKIKSGDYLSARHK